MAERRTAWEVVRPSDGEPELRSVEVFVSAKQVTIADRSPGRGFHGGYTVKKIGDVHFTPQEAIVHYVDRNRSRADLLRRQAADADRLADIASKLEAP